MPIPALPRGTTGPEQFSSYPRLALARGDEVTFSRLHSVEPALVSLSDDNDDERSIFTILCDGRPEGALSIVGRENPRRPPPRRSYARIDIVVVAPHARGMGLGRILILSALSYLLRDHGPDLYSISSLAAHGAVSHTLEDVGFVGEERADQNFTLMKIDVDSKGIPPLQARLTEATEEALKKAAYRIRQRLGPSPPDGDAE